MNQTPQKNVKIGNNIIDLNEVSAITFVDRDILKISFKFKENNQNLEVVFDNPELFYNTQANLKKLTKPMDITLEMRELPPDDYLKSGLY